MEEEKYIEKFLEFLNESIKKSIPKKEKIALAFSGGVDSCVLAKLLKKGGFDFICYVVGIEGCKDFISANKAAKEIGLKLKKIILTERQIEDVIPLQINILKKLNPTPVSLSFTLPLFFISKYSKEKISIRGQGPDELLGGYMKYLKLNKKEVIEKMAEDIKNLINKDYLHDKLTAEHFGKKIILPYLDKKLIEFCICLPFNFKINNRIRKYLLRKVALRIGLSDEIAFKKKKAAQYGTGIMKIMKKIAKKKGIGVGEYIKSL